MLSIELQNDTLNYAHMKNRQTSKVRVSLLEHAGCNGAYYVCKSAERVKWNFTVRERVERAQGRFTVRKTRDVKHILPGA